MTGHSAERKQGGRFHKGTGRRGKRRGAMASGGAAGTGGASDATSPRTPATSSASTTPTVSPNVVKPPAGNPARVSKVPTPPGSPASLPSTAPGSPARESKSGHSELTRPRLTDNEKVQLARAALETCTKMRATTRETLNNVLAFDEKELGIVPQDSNLFKAMQMRFKLGDDLIRDLNAMLESGSATATDAFNVAEQTECICRGDFLLVARAATRRGLPRFGLHTVANDP